MMSFEDVRNGAQFVRFADGGAVAEGRRPDWDDGMVAGGRSGRIGSFLQWSTAASIGGQMLGQALRSKTFAAGGEVEEEHGPSNDGGFLSTAPTGSLLPFLQWHNWYNIYQSTRDKIVAGGGEAAITALAGAVTGPAGAAAASASTALSNVVGNVVQQFSNQADSLRRTAPLPRASQPRLRSLEGRMGGPEIDRSTTINVVRSEGFGPVAPNNALRDRALTYLSHLN